MNGGLRKNGSVSHRSNPAPRCDQIQQQVTITKKRKKRTSNFFNQDGQTLPGFQTPGGPGWQAVEEKSNSRDDINSNESFIGYSNQVTSYQIGSNLLSEWNTISNPQESSKESYLSYSLADNHIDSRYPWWEWELSFFSFSESLSVSQCNAMHWFIFSNSTVLHSSVMTNKVWRFICQNCVQ